MTAAKDLSQVVRDGYDRLDAVYRAWVAGMRSGPRAAFLEEILRSLPPDADVLELGCGPGTDAASPRRAVATPASTSGVQLAHAHAAVPTGTFLQGDLFDVERDGELRRRRGLLRVRARSGLEVRRALRADRRMAPTRRTALRLVRDLGQPGEIEPTWLGAADMYFSSVPPERTEVLL